VLFRDGIAVAALIGGEAQYFVELSAETAWQMKNILLRSPMGEASTQIG
jgi:hypothetical protein